MDKKRRKTILPWPFLKSVICTILGLFFYIAGKKIVPFPERWMGAEEGCSLLFLGISSHLSANLLLSQVFMLINTEEDESEKMQRWKNNLSRVLSFIFFIGMGLINYWKYISSKAGSIAFLTLILAVVNCLIDTLIQLMNKHGVCNGFNLLLFVEFLPTKWFSEVLFTNVKNNWSTNEWKQGSLLTQPWFCILVLLLMSVFFTWIINIKWEVPVESNTTHFANNSLIKKHQFKLGFRMNFSFMSLYTLSWILSTCYIVHNIFFVLPGSMPPNASKNFLVRTVQRFQWVSSDYANKESLSNLSNTWKGGGDRFWKSAFLLNNSKRPFGHIFSWQQGERSKLFLALAILILLRWWAAWSSVRKYNLKTKVISDKLRRRGIYIDQVPPGEPTRNLLKKAINWLVFFWFCTFLIFNFFFDQIFANLENNMGDGPSIRLGSNLYFASFLDWFGSVGIGVDLFRQIRTKYEYNQGKN